MYEAGLEDLVLDCPILENNYQQDITYDEEFQLWKLLKQKAFSKIARSHNAFRYGEFIASKLKLPIDNTTPMELDLLGTHEDGLFILELKVNRSAERNAFSELFAYSNYIAGVFTASGRHDIKNILVAELEVKITRQAFLYDLLIADRDIIVYKPIFPSGTLESLRLELYLPSDEDFKVFTNDLLSHDSMSCVVASFHDLEGWYDSEEESGSLNYWTKEHLGKLSSYAAQLMEAEGLHGFCFIRKPWKEIPRFYRNSLFICAINPFRFCDTERAQEITQQFLEEDRSAFFEYPQFGFDGRLIRLSQRAIRESLTHDHSCEVETPLWAAVVNSMEEVVITHNFAFRPTGLLREAYVCHLDNIYALNEQDADFEEDVSILKVNEITNWFGAWTFMEAFGFKNEP